jgi:hypothetical protein
VAVEETTKGLMVVLEEMVAAEPDKEPLLELRELMD